MHLFSRAFPTAPKAFLLTLIGIQSISADVVINEIHYDEDNKTVRSEFIETIQPQQRSLSISLAIIFPAELTSNSPPGPPLLPEDTWSSRKTQPPCSPALATRERWDLSRTGPLSRIPANASLFAIPPEPPSMKLIINLASPGPPWGMASEPREVSPSIELTNPLLDNDLGGSWRASGFPAATSNSGGGGGGPVNYIAAIPRPGDISTTAATRGPHGAPPDLTTRVGAVVPLNLATEIPTKATTVNSRTHGRPLRHHLLPRFNQHS